MLFGAQQSAQQDVRLDQFPPSSGIRDETDYNNGERSDPRGANSVTTTSTTVSSPAIRACLLCRRWKMRCVGADIAAGLPCARCRKADHDCVFAKSRKGKKPVGKAAEVSSRHIKVVDLAVEEPERSTSSLHTLQSAPTRSSPQVSALTTSPAKWNSTIDVTDIVQQNHMDDLVQRGLILSNLGSMPDRFEREYSHISPTDSAPTSLLPDITLNPLGLLAEASLSKDIVEGRSTSPRPRPHGESFFLDSAGEIGQTAPSLGYGLRKEGSGLGTSSYFEVKTPSTHGCINMNETTSRVSDLLGLSQISDLFEVWYKRFHPQLPILDQVIHTPTVVSARCEFLLVTICAISSRHHNSHLNTRSQLLDLAKQISMEIHWSGQKSVEIVQAYLILANYPLKPAISYAFAKNWQLLGSASSMAVDLNLFRRKSCTSLAAHTGRSCRREIKNRERTWLICFILDRSMSAQMGKPWSVQEDEVIKGCLMPAWYADEFSPPSDCFLASYAQTLQILSRALDALYWTRSPSNSALANDLNYLLLLKNFTNQITRSVADGFNLIGESLGNAGGHAYLFSFHSKYYTLVLASFGLHYALQKSPVDLTLYFSQVHDAALGAMKMWIDQMSSGDQIVFAAEGGLVMISYTVLSALKLIRSDLADYHTDPMFIIRQAEIIADTLIQNGLDDQHLPRLYGRLLRKSVFNKMNELNKLKMSTPLNQYMGFHKRNLAMASTAIRNSGTNSWHTVPAMTDDEMVAESFRLEASNDRPAYNAQPYVMQGAQEGGALSDQFDFSIWSEDMLRSDWLDFGYTELPTNYIDPFLTNGILGP